MHRLALTPAAINFTDNWMAAAKAANAGYTLLVASHCSGFFQWQVRALYFTCEPLT